MCKRKPLLEFIRSSRNASSLYHKLLALPLLPPDLIPTAFLELKSKIMLTDSEGIFANFLKYFEGQWIRKIGCKNFSVYNQKTRTTSAVEAYNGVLGRFAEKSGHFFKFVKLIRNEEYFKSRHFSMMCDSGGAVGTKRRKRSKVETHKKIYEATELLNNKSITPGEFLSRMVYEKNNICVDMVPHMNIFTETSPENESESDSDNEICLNSDENECVVCKNEPPNIVALPCRHLKICGECNVKLLAEAISKGSDKFNCPYCRNIVNDTIQVFL